MSNSFEGNVSLWFAKIVEFSRLRIYSLWHFRWNVSSIEKFFLLYYLRVPPLLLKLPHFMGAISFPQK